MDEKNGFDNRGAEFDEEDGRRTKSPKKTRQRSARNKKKYGEARKYDPTFHGPTENRSCTDIICCIFFLVFAVGIVVLGGYAYYSGDPLTLIYATDYKGNVCGRTAGFENKPYLFYFDLLDCFSANTVLEAGCPTTKLCLQFCPDVTFAPLTLLLLGKLGEAASEAGVPDGFLDIPQSEWDKMMCEYNFDPQQEYNDINSRYYGDLLKILEDKKCASYYFESQPYFERCIPAFLVSNTSKLSDAFDDAVGDYIMTGSSMGSLNQSSLQENLEGAVETLLDLTGVLQFLYQDFVSSWYIIMIGLAIGMGLSLIWIIIMRWIAAVMVWGSIFILYGILGAGIWYCFKQYQDLGGMGQIDDPTFAFVATLASFLRLQKTWLAFGCILLIFFLILLLTTLCLCTRIRIATQLITEASKAVGRMMSTLFFPILPFFFQVVVVSLWAIIAVYLATSHQVRYEVYNAPTDFPIANRTECDIDTFNSTYNVNNTNAACVFHSYKLPDYTLYLQFVNIFAMFWFTNFVIALGQLTLAGAFASYFWAYDKSTDVPNLPLTRSFWWAIRYHLGSIAFGSLIIAVIKLIRVILEYVELKLKGQTSKVVKFILKCLQCCFWCLEKFMKFINKNAYIMIAIYGKNFCTSAKDAFFLLMRNIIRVAVINKVTDYLLLLGELCVVGGVVVASFFYFTMQITYINDILPVPQLNYYWVVIIVIAIGVFVIARGFFSVFDMAVDTMFLSFLEDLERHDGSPEKPYYMSKDLMKIVGKKNKKRPEDDSDSEMDEEW